MCKENISQDFRLNNIDEVRNLFEEIYRNELISKKHKKVCTTLNYNEYFVILAYNYWMHFNFRFCYFDWYSSRNYESWNGIKNLRNDCGN